MHSDNPGGTLLDRALKLLKDKPEWLSFKTIADDISVSPAWLAALSRGEIPDPGVNKIQRLNDYLEVPRFTCHETFKITEFRTKSKDAPHLCIYIVWSNNICLYIGHTVRLRARILNHNRLREFVANNATHIEAEYVGWPGYSSTFQQDCDCHEKERRLIRHMRPKLNLYGTGKTRPRAI